MKKFTSIITAVIGLALCASAALAIRPKERVSPNPRCNKHAVVWHSESMPKHPQCGDVWVNPVDGMEMVFVEGGTFRMGCDEVADERPYRHESLGGYWIAKYEVTVAQYRKFCSITGHTMPAEPETKWLGNSPIVNIDWNDASAYAKWVNGHLTSEEEWEKAARGFCDVYPWGNSWDAKRCNNASNGKNAPVAVGSFPEGASQFGVQDLAGNVAEWCADRYQKKGDTMDYRVIRGGSCHDVSSDTFRASRRDYLAPSAKVDVIGFRYAMKAL